MFFISALDHFQIQSKRKSELDQAADARLDFTFAFQVLTEDEPLLEWADRAELKGLVIFFISSSCALGSFF